MAVTAFRAQQVNRIILTRPAVEAGEKARLPAGRPAAEGGPLPAPAVRRAVRHARRGDVPEVRGARQHRGRAARLHARQNARRQLRHSGRGPEHHLRADEDVPDAPRLQLQNGHHQATSRRSTCRTASAPACATRCACCATSTTSRFSALRKRTSCVTGWYRTSYGRTKGRPLQNNSVGIPRTGTAARGAAHRRGFPEPKGSWHMEKNQSHYHKQPRRQSRFPPACAC